MRTMSQQGLTVSIGLKHLRYAEAAERCGSFRRAALGRLDGGIEPLLTRGEFPLRIAPVQ